MPTTGGDTNYYQREADLRNKISAKDPGVCKELKEIINSGDENPNFRSSAISMLASNFPEDYFPDALNLLEDKTQPLRVRLAVLGSIIDNKYINGVPAVKKVAVNRETNLTLRTRAYEVIAKLDPGPGHDLVFEAVKDPLESEALRANIVKHLDPKRDPDDRKLLLQIVGDKENYPELRSKAISKLKDCTDIGNDLFTKIIKDEHENSIVIQASLAALDSMPGNTGKDALWQIYNDASLPRGRKYLIIPFLAKYAGDDKIRREAVQSIIHGDERSSIEFYVGDSIEWKEVAKEFIEALNAETIRRADLKAALILQAIKSATRSRGLPPGIGYVPDNELVGYLIEVALDQNELMNERMMGIIGELIIEGCHRDLDQAGDAINAYEKREEISSERVEKLRVQIGGPTALGPLLDITNLKKNLNETFRTPIDELNRETKDKWLETIKHAKWGFIARNCMSVTVFIIGASLLGISVYMFFKGGAELKNFWGPGVSFISGLGSMLAVVYTGPLRDIKQSVNDIGKANTAFIGYIHRVLEVSHTFEIFFIKDEIDYVKLKYSCGLISEAMQDTIKLLSEPELKKKKKKESDVK